MIDTDKYEGYTENRRDKLGTFKGNDIFVWDWFALQLPMWASKADVRLVEDAPVLLDEVKRLRLLFRELIKDMDADDYIEWCNRIGCPDGLEVEAMKND